jgi:NitT/TauT family transport system ATP-binding protein
MVREIRLKGIKKSYGTHCVLDGLSFALPAGSCTCLMGLSGIGKTTLFRLLLGLEQPDGGEILGLEGLRVSAVFQEDRLLENLTAVENVALTAARMLKREEVRRSLEQLLPAEALDQPVSQQSGGMRRRVALVRAVLAPADVWILDEPFTGLDSESREKAISFLLEHKGARTCIFSSHHREDAEEMKAEIWNLSH